MGGPIVDSRSLLATQTVLPGKFGLIQPSPPDNQWILEVENLFQIGLAQLQRQIIEYVGGYVSADDATQPGQTDVFCQQQMVPLPAGFQNFSILGIAILITIGGLIIILGYSIDGIVGYIQDHSAQASYARLSWQLENSLQLQRMAQENAGWGAPWARQLDTVPHSNGRAMLGVYHSSGGDTDGARAGIVKAASEMEELDRDKDHSYRDEEQPKDRLLPRSYITEASSLAGDQ